MVEELEQATNHFSRNNLIGYGSFGAVYKGLHTDGTVLAIKRRLGSSQKELVAEVKEKACLLVIYFSIISAKVHHLSIKQATYLSGIRHRNLVTLLGYCQEKGIQMLVYEYLPNGNMCNHLYGTNYYQSRV